MNDKITTTDLNNILSLQIQYNTDKKYIVDLFNKLDTLSTTHISLSSAKSNISTYGITPTLKTLVGNELTNSIGIDEDNDGDKLMEFLDSKMTHVTNKMLLLSKHVMSASRTFITNTADDMLDVVTKIERTLADLHKHKSCKFTTDQLDVNIPVITLQNITTYVPKLDKCIKTTFKMINDNNWKNTNIVFNVLTEEYVENIKINFSATNVETLNVNQVESALLLLHNNIKAAKYVLTFMKNISNHMQINTNREFNVNGDERNPIEILRYCNLILFSVLKYMYIHLQAHVLIINNIVGSDE